MKSNRKEALLAEKSKLCEELVACERELRRLEEIRKPVERLIEEMQGWQCRLRGYRFREAEVEEVMRAWDEMSVHLRFCGTQS